MSELNIGAGLNNLGNTCFFNAVIQTVLHTRKMASELSKKKHSMKCKKSDWCAFCEMEKMFHATRNRRSYAPNGMINNLRKIFKKFRLGRQEDSHEFLRYLIEGMQQCETGKPFKDRQKNEKAIKKTKIFSIFGGVMQNVVQCLSCKHKSITKQRYYDINIECQRSNSLEEGLKRFFAADELKGQNKYSCEACKNKVDALKRCKVESTPYTLTFQLKRFNNMLRKIGKFIKYPKYLHMGEYHNEVRKTIFRLYAVIVHAGGSSYSGHYYSYVRVGESWSKMDDSWVSKCTEQQAMSQNAYILIYEKVKDEELETKKQEIVSNGTTTTVNSTSQKVIDSKLFEQNIGHQPKKVNQESKEQLKKAIIQKYLKKQEEEQKELESNFTKDLVKSDERQKPLLSDSPVKGKEQVKISILKRPAPTLQEEKDSSDSDEEDQSEYQLPVLGERRKSKQQMQQNMSLKQLITRYAFNMLRISKKMPKEGEGRRVLRSVNKLRKYELIMKKRKLPFQ